MKGNPSPWFGARARRLAWPVATLVCILGAFAFLVRGPLEARNPGSNIDSALVLTSTRLWIAGENPYDPAKVEAEWRKWGTFEEANPGARGRQAIVYPPSMYAILSPWGLVPGDRGAIVWTVSNTLMYGWCLYALAGIAGIRWSNPLAWTMLGVCLGIGGVQKNISLGQPGTLLLFLTTLGIVLRRSGRSQLGGALLGVATICKPQHGAVFMLHELVGRRPKVFAAGVIAAVALFAAAGARLWLGGAPDWFAWWLGNVKAFSGPGGQSHLPTAFGDQLYRALGLNVLLYRFTQAEGFSHAAGLLLTTGAAAAYFAIGPRRRREMAPPDEIGDLAAVAVATLLFTIHRYYDMMYLIFPVALAFRRLNDGKVRSTLPLIVSIAPLMLPLPSVLFVLYHDNRISAIIWEHPVTQYFFLYVHHFALVGVFASIIYSRWIDSRTSSGADLHPTAGAARK